MDDDSSDPPVVRVLEAEDTPANRDGRPVTTYVPLSRARLWVVLLSLWATAATLGLGWEVLRRHEPAKAPATLTAATTEPTPITETPDARAEAAPAVAAPEPAFPTYASTVPAAFRGAWDELTLDGCAGRAPRYTIAEQSFSEFDVRWDVTKVEIFSPTEIRIFTTTRDEDGGQVDGAWNFRLADDGKSLTWRKKSGAFFHRCPS